jgi:hypothetical protein
LAGVVNSVAEETADDSPNAAGKRHSLWVRPNFYTPLGEAVIADEECRGCLGASETKAGLEYLFSSDERDRAIMVSITDKGMNPFRDRTNPRVDVVRRLSLLSLAVTDSRHVVYHAFEINGEHWERTPPVR